MKQDHPNTYRKEYSNNYQQNNNFQYGLHNEIRGDNNRREYNNFNGGTSKKFSREFDREYDRGTNHRRGANHRDVGLVNRHNYQGSRGRGRKGRGRGRSDIHSRPGGRRALYVPKKQNCNKREDNVNYSRNVCMESISRTTSELASSIIPITRSGNHRVNFSPVDNMNMKKVSDIPVGISELQLSERNTEKDHFIPTLAPPGSDMKIRSFNNTESKNMIEVPRSTPVESISPSRKVKSGRGPRKSRGSRGINANHLLNFQFERPKTKRTYPRKTRRGPKFKKETFIQANCHFLLEPGEHVESMIDPDHHVNWQAVHCVFLPTDQIPNCPICLDKAVAPKITKCGHIFCTTCILHYLHLSIKNWSRCPLCFEPVYKNALKSLEFRLHKKYKEDDIIDFVLVQRSKGSVAVFERSRLSRPDSWSTIDHSFFARITVSRDISRTIKREREELLNARNTQDDVDAVFINMALADLKEREKQWSKKYPQNPTEKASMKKRGSSRRKHASSKHQKVVKILKPPPSTSHHSAKIGRIQILKREKGVNINPCQITGSGFSSIHNEERKNQDKKKKFSFNPNAFIFDPTTKSHGIKVNNVINNSSLEPSVNSSNIQTMPSSKNSPQGDDIEQKKQHSINEENDTGDTYYFYQSQDGQQLFLNSLNFRCLKEEFRSTRNFPLHVRGRIIELLTYEQTEETRRKKRFLKHLPLTSKFTIALVDLSHIVSPETNALFAPQFKTRIRKREKEKQKRERERKKQQKQADIPLCMLQRETTNDGIIPEYVEELPTLENQDTSFPKLPTASEEYTNKLKTGSSSKYKCEGKETSSPKRTTTGWSEVAEKGFCTSLWNPLPEETCDSGFLEDDNSFSSMLVAQIKERQKLSEIKEKKKSLKKEASKPKAHFTSDLTNSRIDPTLHNTEKPDLGWPKLGGNESVNWPKPGEETINVKKKVSKHLKPDNMSSTSGKTPTERTKKSKRKFAKKKLVSVIRW